MSISQSKSLEIALEILSEAEASAPRKHEAAATIITQLRSETSRVFQASYISHLNRIDSDLFRCGVRAFFCLPPVIYDTSNVTYCSDTGCRLQLCAPCLDAGRPRDECKIFPDGSHCQSGAGGQLTRTTKLPCTAWRIISSPLAFVPNATLPLVSCYLASMVTSRVATSSPRTREVASFNLSTRCKRRPAEVAKPLIHGLEISS